MRLPGTAAKNHGPENTVPELAVLHLSVTHTSPSKRQRIFGDLCPYDRLGLRELLTFRSGTVYWDSWSPPARIDRAVSPCIAGLRPAARSASLSELGIRAEMTQPEPAFSARHGRRESTRRQIRRPGAAGGFDGLIMQDHHQLWLPVWLPYDHLKLRKTVGAAGFEPAAPRL
jgi:hypothetical protein